MIDDDDEEGGGKGNGGKEDQGATNGSEDADGTGVGGAGSEGVLDPTKFGEPRGKEQQWAAQLRVVDAKEGETLQTVQLAQDEMLLSICKVQFTVSQGFTHVLVGGVRGWDPRKGTHEA